MLIAYFVGTYLAWPLLVGTVLSTIVGGISFGFRGPFWRAFGWTFTVTYSITLLTVLRLLELQANGSLH